jgi:hypothetical protein
VPSPRAAKRFTNIYRLLKAPLRGVELQSFEGSARLPGNFRAPMLLLALSMGFPDLAADIFGQLTDGRDRTEKASKWLNGLTRLAANRIDSERLSRCLAPALQAGVPATLAPFVDWAPRVARFSFDGIAVSETLESPPSDATSAAAARPRATQPVEHAS